MVRWRRALALLASVAVAACGDSGGSSGGPPPPPPPPTFTMSGTVSAAAGQVMDSDTGDSRDVPKTLNNSRGAAQRVSSAARIAGWVSADADPVDTYRVSLAAGQAAVLVPDGSARADLTLCLQDVLRARAEACSTGGSGNERVPAVVADEYYVEVSASLGAANYALTFGVTSLSAPGAGALGSDAEFVPGEVLVRFRDDAPAAARAGDEREELRARAAAVGLEPLGGAARGRPALLGLGASRPARALALSRLGVPAPVAGTLAAPLDETVAAKLDTLRAVKALRARPDVASADPNYVVHASAVPPNELYPLQWHYPLIDLPQAWDVPGARGAGVRVAVIDTGIVAEHADFGGGSQLVAGYDFISSATVARDGDGRDPDPNDPGDSATKGQSSWHGTHVAGTIAAAWRSDSRGAAGIAPEAKVMPLRVLGAGGGTSADVLEALRYAAGLPNSVRTLGPDERADVVNLSLGCLDCFSATEQAVYTEVRNAGVIVVAAAGNERTSRPGYPASYDGVVSVSAVDMARRRAPYSNTGPTVDVAAPGGNTSVDSDGNGYGDGVLSAVADDQTTPRTPRWAFYQGTSMASPHVAGVVALMKSVCRSLTPAQLDAILQSRAMTTVVPGGATTGRDDTFGYGLVDAFLAVQAAQAQCGRPIPAGVQATPPRADLGSGAGPATVTLTRLGDPLDPPLAITAVTASAPWIQITPSPPAGEGFGTYTIAVDRTALAGGSYAGVVRFTRSDGGGDVLVPVTMLVGTDAAGPGDAGYLYVLLLDSSGNVRAELQGSGAGGGSYPFTFTGVPAGEYFVVAGTDSDDDGVICDEGEVCGAWPTLGLPTAAQVSGNTPGLDFGVGIDVSIGTLSAGGARGFRLPPGAKGDGGAKAYGGAR